MGNRRYYACSLRDKRGHPLGVYYKGGILSDARFMGNLYFYEEDNKYYEFFTGKLLGEGSPALADSNLLIDTGWEDSYGRYRSYELTASAFAEQVKPYMKYRDTIVRKLEKLFREQKEAWQKKLLEEAEEKARNKKIDDNNESWLDSILDSRK